MDSPWPPSPQAKSMLHTFAPSNDGRWFRLRHSTDHNEITPGSSFTFSLGQGCSGLEAERAEQQGIGQDSP